MVQRLVLRVVVFLVVVVVSLVGHVFQSSGLGQIAWTFKSYWSSIDLITVCPYWCYCFTTIVTSVCSHPDLLMTIEGFNHHNSIAPWCLGAIATFTRLLRDNVVNLLDCPEWSGSLLWFKLFKSLVPCKSGARPDILHQCQGHPALPQSQVPCDKRPAGQLLKLGHIERKPSYKTCEIHVIYVHVLHFLGHIELFTVGCVPWLLAGAPTKYDQAC